MGYHTATPPVLHSPVFRRLIRDSISSEPECSVSWAHPTEGLFTLTIAVSHRLLKPLRSKRPTGALNHKPGRFSFGGRAGGVKFERLSLPTDKQTNKQSKYELICSCGWLDHPLSLDSETTKKLTKTVRSNRLLATERTLARLSGDGGAPGEPGQSKKEKKYSVMSRIKLS